MPGKRPLEVQGLHFMAFDLHVHTPASKDFKDKRITPEEIVKAALTASLDAICITDHNTAEWVDLVSEAAKRTKLVVFPGVEISVMGGKEGPIHIIGIFTQGTSSEEICDLLSRVGLTKAKRGDLNELAEGDPNTVVDEITKQRGIPILAHSDSSHGVLHDMRGQPRKRVVQNLNLLAAEASNPDYIRFLDGKDNEYKRFLPTYESSDAHSMASIGSKRTYFKVSSPSLEAIRQCFLDPELRLCGPDTYSHKTSDNFPRIVSLSIDAGFFQDSHIRFHPCQNCLIGGQGVGKSLIIEFVRFALNQSSNNDQIRRDAEGKLSLQLGIGGTVKIEFQLANGTKYKVARKYDGVENPAEVVNSETGEAYRGDITALFPIVAYSQTEAVEISRNQNAQLELIDGLIDAASIQEDIKSTQQTLLKNDIKLSQLTSAQTTLKEISKEISTKAEAIKNIEKALKNPILTSMKQAEELKNALELHLAYPDELLTAIDEWLKALSESYTPPSSTTKHGESQALSKAIQVSKATYTALHQSLIAAKANLRAAKSSQGKLLSGWRPQYNTILNRYEKFLRAQGGDIKSIAARRRRLLDEKQDLEKKWRVYKQQASQIEDVFEKRKLLLQDLIEKQHALYEARRIKYEELTALSDGKLRVSIRQGSDVSAFTEALTNIATGTHIRKTDIGTITGLIPPVEFVDMVFAGNAEVIATRSKIEKDTAIKLTNWLISLEAREKVLALQHAYLPQDSPLIEFKKDDGQYYPISEMSVGQKCTALLMIALATGANPIIIDQPEESIDIASVFSDVVSKLRANKYERQFLLTTHNPNIAVTADSDLIHVLKASATKGHIDRSGAIDDEPVKSEVIDHLEGGRAPYLLRGRKYGLVRDFNTGPKETNK